MSWRCIVDGGAGCGSDGVGAGRWGDRLLLGEPRSGLGCRGHSTLLLFGEHFLVFRYTERNLSVS